MSNGFCGTAHCSTEQPRSMEKYSEGQQMFVLLRGDDVDRRCGISRSSRYAKLDPRSPAFDTNFPVPVRIGPNTVRWIESEVDAYIAALPRTRSQGGTK
jgi:prophage regulatory protein